MFSEPDNFFSQRSVDFFFLSQKLCENFMTKLIKVLFVSWNFSPEMYRNNENVSNKILYRTELLLFFQSWDPDTPAAVRELVKSVFFPY